MTARPRILFVAMHNSIHTARWINTIADEGWDLHLFPVDPAVPHERLRNVTLHRPFYHLDTHGALAPIFARRRTRTGEWTATDAARRHQVRFRPIYRVPGLSALDRLGAYLPKVSAGSTDMRYPMFYSPRVLARLIGRLKPDLVHSLEFQHCGYRVLGAKEVMAGDFPPWLASNWGSDIYHFRQFPEHRTQIEHLLRSADYYACECLRDVHLARKHGFMGKVMPVMPNTGGFDLERIADLSSGVLPSARRLVMVKGYQHFVGRAMTALDAVEMCRDVLADYTVVLFSASPEVIERGRRMAEQGGVSVRVVPNASPHEDILRLQGQARVYLGVSASDAISTSMLEAMAMGAFPIQTDTSCCEEWIEDGKTGFRIPVDDVGTIAAKLRSALTDDALVDQAAELNSAVVGDRLDHRILRQKVKALYEDVFADVRERRKI